MGLLETLIARVTRLEQQAGIMAEVVFIDEAETVAAPATPAAPAAPVVAGVITDTSVNVHGIPWNADLHAATKTTNQDGHWKAKKGVDKSLIETYNAKFVAADTPTAPAAPAAPAIPAAPALTTPPAPPSLSTPPAPPAAPAIPAVTNEQLTAVKYIQELTNDWNVPYANVVAALIAPHGAERFDTVDPKHHAQIRDEALAWIELLADIDSDIERLDTAGNATGNVVSSSVMTLLQSHGGCQKLADVPREKLAAVSANLKPFADQWVAYAQAQGKM